MRGPQSFRRTTTAEDGDMALALVLAETERERGSETERERGSETEVPHSQHSTDRASIHSDSEGQLYEHAADSTRATTAEPAPWVDEDDRLQRTVSQRLGSIKYSKHLPRVNSQPLSPEDSSTARARLLSRLDMYGLCEVSVHGDGNCQFRALSDQLYRTPDEHDFIRAAAINQLRSCPDLYQDYIPENYQEYCQRMQQFGTWGDHVTLQAVADAFGVRIAIMTSYQDGCVVEIQPHGLVKSQRILYLSFWAEVHYNSVYPQGEAPVQPSKSKVLGSKKLGRFIHAFAV